MSHNSSSGLMNQYRVCQFPRVLTRRDSSLLLGLFALEDTAWMCRKEERRSGVVTKGSEPVVHHLYLQTLGRALTKAGVGNSGFLLSRVFNLVAIFSGSHMIFPFCCFPVIVHDSLYNRGRSVG